MTMTMSMSTLSTSTSELLCDSWEKEHYLALTLWDIDREFQKSHEAYEQWLTKNRRKKSRWECFGSGKLDDEIGKTLSLGRQVRALLENGIDTFGSRFEQGDSTCNATLSAQLLRVQHEIRVPIEDAALARFSITIPRDELLTAAKGVRRACLQALKDQYDRLRSPTTTPFLPPPRFSVNFCPFAAKLQKEKKKDNFTTKKVRRHDRHDEREICPHCSVHISVSHHSGLPEYRRLLFQAHLSPARDAPSGSKATFACTSCYKTFDDSYGYLDHVFQKEIMSERSCQKRWSITHQWHLNRIFVESDPALVDKCLRNCLKRELTRARAVKKMKELDYPTKSRTARANNPRPYDDGAQKTYPYSSRGWNWSQRLA